MAAGTIVHLELLSAQFERSAAFYAEVFGWKADGAQTGGHRGFQAPAGPSGSWVLEALAQATGPVAFVGVTDLEASLGAVEKAGGRVLVRRQAMGARGTGALFVDPDGNVMGLMTVVETALRPGVPGDAPAPAAKSREGKSPPARKSAGKARPAASVAGKKKPPAR